MTTTPKDPVDALMALHINNWRTPMKKILILSTAVFLAACGTPRVCPDTYGCSGGNGQPGNGIGAGAAAGNPGTGGPSGPGPGAGPGKGPGKGDSGGKPGHGKGGAGGKGGKGHGGKK